MAQQCKVCGSGVPDDRETCQICNAPMKEEAAAPAGATAARPAGGAPVAGIPGLPTAPDAPSMSGGGSGDMRVSLTGEVLEVAPPTPRGSGPGGYGPPPAARPGTGPMPAPAAGGRYGGAVHREEAPSSGGSKVAIIVLVLLLLGGGAFGGWWWYSKQKAPLLAAEKFTKALQEKNWDTALAMTEGSDADKAQIKTILALAGQFLTFKDMKLGDVKVNGNTATVDFTGTVEFSGMGQSQSKSFNEPLGLTLVNGEWKIKNDSRGGFGGGFGGGMGGAGGGAPGGGMMAPPGLGQ